MAEKRRSEVQLARCVPDWVGAVVATVGCFSFPRALEDPKNRSSHSTRILLWHIAYRALIRCIYFLDPPRALGVRDLVKCPKTCYQALKGPASTLIRVKIWSFIRSNRASLYLEARGRTHSMIAVLISRFFASAVGQVKARLEAPFEVQQGPPKETLKKNPSIPHGHLLPRETTHIPGWLSKLWSLFGSLV